MNRSDAIKEAPTPNRPARLTREQSRAQTRERLLASAAVVFSREGFAGASVDRIAEEAGYSKGALYSNFSSKDELFFELFDYYAGGQADELCRRLDAVEGAEEAIATVCTWANGLQHEPDLRMLVLDLTRLVRNHTVLFERHTRLFDEGSGRRSAAGWPRSSRTAARRSRRWYWARW